MTQNRGCVIESNGGYRVRPFSNQIITGPLTNFVGLDVHIRRWNFLDSIFRILGKFTGDVIENEGHRFVVISKSVVVRELEDTPSSDVVGELEGPPSPEIARIAGIAFAYKIVRDPKVEIKRFSYYCDTVKFNPQDVESCATAARVFGLPVTDVVHFLENVPNEARNDVVNGWNQAIQLIQDFGISPASLLKEGIPFAPAALLVPDNMALEKWKEIREKANQAIDKLGAIDQLSYTNPRGEVKQFNDQQLAIVKKTIQQAIAHSTSLKNIQHNESDTSRRMSMIYAIAPHIRVLTVLSGTDLKMYGCWGKLLGEGSSGLVFHTVNLMTGELTDPLDPYAAIKLPKPDPNLLPDISSSECKEGEPEVIDWTPFNEQSDMILVEYQNLRRIHQGKQMIPGIQNPLQVNSLENELEYPKKELFKTVILQDHGNNPVRYRCHWGRLYGGVDLEKVGKSVPVEEKKEIAGQIFHGLAYLHSNLFTHGDIKPQNILVDYSESTQQYRAYLADFAGMMDHPTEPRHPKTWIPDLNQAFLVTPEFRLQCLDAISRGIYTHQSVSPETAHNTFFYSESTSDVFAVCSTIYQLFVGELPQQESQPSDPNKLNTISYQGIKYSINSVEEIKENLLKYKDLKEDQIDGLVRGLRAGFDKGRKPITAQELSGLFTFDPERYSQKNPI